LQAVNISELGNYKNQLKCEGRLKTNETRLAISLTMESQGIAKQACYKNEQTHQIQYKYRPERRPQHYN
jgi:hypothetical protein